MLLSSRNAARSLALVPALLAVLAVTAAWGSVIISKAVTRRMSCAANICTPTAANAVLNAADLQAMLASASVTVKSQSSAQDIVVAAPLTWTSGITLTLDAWRSLTVNQPVSVTGVGGLSVLTNDGGSDGHFSFGARGRVTFASLSSPLTINGSAYMLANSIAGLAGAMATGSSGFYALANSYDAAPDGVYPAPPIGTKTSGYGTVFQGTLEGLGNTISNLAIGDPAGYTAGMVGQNRGLIENLVLSKANVSGGELVGGLAGSNENGSLFGDAVDEAMISAPRNGTAGVLAGETLFGSITNCRTSGSVSGATVGGLVGYSNNTVSGSSSSARVEGSQDFMVGGLIGENQGGITTSYATGAVAGGQFLGGLVGYTDVGSISNAYATGAVAKNPTRGGASIGGLAGHTQNVKISSAYASGAPTGPAGSPIGGLIGSDTTSGTASQTYWDITTSGIGNLSQGAGSPANDPGITGLTTTQLQAGLPPGFDPAVWGEDPNVNGGLPYLLANPPQ